ncbi:MAG: peptidoglycan DD-metalloendopeptidase family protein [Sphingobacteriia bacterium]|nr:peptidoglycan DD-metalloendopeptidase family protein [Sphingobacteriia bacterium]
MSNSTFYVKIFSLLMLVTLILTGNDIYGQSSARKKLESQRKGIENEIINLNSALKEVTNNRKEALRRAIILGATIQKREELIGTIQKEVDLLDQRIEGAQNQMNRLNSELVTLKSDYARMVSAAWINRGKFNRLMFLLSSQSFNQAYLRLKYFQQYGEFRREQARLIVATNDSIMIQKRQLSNLRLQRQGSLVKLDNEKKNLVNERSEQETNAIKLAGRQEEIKRDIARKKAAERELKEGIEKMIAEEIRLANAKKAKSTKKKISNDKNKTNAPSKSDVFELTPEEKLLSQNFAGNRGRLPWPVEKGYVSEPFGEHAHPIVKSIRTRNNGVNIASPKNTECRAVFEGVVTRVMSIPGYNSVVIIRHGNYLSVYSNLSEVYVSQGSKVSNRQTLGRVATAENGVETDLHFEIWDGKTQINPMFWLSPR